jgi:hypothetical protein
VEALVSRGTEMKIPISDLQSMSPDLTNGAVLRAYSQDQYRFLRVNRREIYREWPSAFYWRLFFDKTWKIRRLRIVPDVADARSPWGGLAEGVTRRLSWGWRVTLR